MIRKNMKKKIASAFAWFSNKLKFVVSILKSYPVSRLMSFGGFYSLVRFTKIGYWWMDESVHWVIKRYTTQLGEVPCLLTSVLCVVLSIESIEFIQWLINSLYLVYESYISSGPVDMGLPHIDEPPVDNNLAAPNESNSSKVVSAKQHNDMLMLESLGLTLAICLLVVVPFIRS